jgi:hypothetical protein
MFGFGKVKFAGSLHRNANGVKLASDFEGLSRFGV